jgi:hypothetical protein
MFSPLLKTKDDPFFPTLIQDYRNIAFVLFINNYLGLIKDFNNIYNFLY